MEALARHPDSTQDAATIARKINFFKNATRRDPTALERKAIVNVNSKSACAGFFVKNRANDFLIATARHCAAYDFEKACKEGGVDIVTSEGYKGQCDSVVAEGREDDMVVFKARLIGAPQKILASIDFLKLSAAPAPRDAPLKVIGFPQDEYRDGRMTVTENCWINGGTNVADLLTMEELQAVLQRREEMGRDAKEDADLAAREEFVEEHAQIEFNNCTIYQGNSGGPMTLAGRPIVVGMPYKSVRGVYRLFPETAANRSTSMAGFVRRNRLALEQAGVVIVDKLEK